MTPLDFSMAKLTRRAAELRAAELAAVPWCGWALTGDGWEMICTRPTSAEALLALEADGWCRDCETAVLRQGERPADGQEPAIAGDQGGADVLPFPGKGGVS